MQVKGTAGSSINRITLQLNHSRTISINAVVKPRQSIGCEQNHLYITDENHNRISAINSSEIPQLQAGTNDITIILSSPDKTSFNLNFLFTTMGAPQ
jgi:hypothetical protein